MLAEIVALHLSADISYSPGYKCSCSFHSFATGIWGYLLHGSKYISNHCVCHLYLYSQLPCVNISYKVGACKRWGPPWNGSGNSISYGLVFPVSAIWKVLSCFYKHSRFNAPMQGSSSLFFNKMKTRKIKEKTRNFLSKFPEIWKLLRNAAYEYEWIFSKVWNFFLI